MSKEQAPQLPVPETDPLPLEVSLEYGRIAEIEAAVKQAYPAELFRYSNTPGKDRYDTDEVYLTTSTHGGLRDEAAKKLLVGMAKFTDFYMRGEAEEWRADRIGLAEQAGELNESSRARYEKDVLNDFDYKYLILSVLTTFGTFSERTLSTVLLQTQGNVDHLQLRDAANYIQEQFYPGLQD